MQLRNRLGMASVPAVLLLTSTTLVGQHSPVPTASADSVSALIERFRAAHQIPGPSDSDPRSCGQGSLAWRMSAPRCR